MGTRNKTSNRADKPALWTDLIVRVLHSVSMTPSEALARGLISALCNLLEVNAPKVVISRRGPSAYVVEEKTIIVAVPERLDQELTFLAEEITKKKDEIVRFCKETTLGAPLVLGPREAFKFAKLVKNVATSTLVPFGTFILDVAGLRQELEELTEIVKVSFGGIAALLPKDLLELAEKSLAFILEDTDRYRRKIAEEIADQIRDYIRLCLPPQELGIDVKHVKLCDGYLSVAYALADATLREDLDACSETFEIVLRLSCPANHIYALAKESVNYLKRVIAITIWATALNAPEKVDQAVALYCKVKQLEEKVQKTVQELVDKMTKKCIQL